VSQGIEETEETVRGETAQLPSDKRRHFGLVDVKNPGGLVLCQATRRDDVGDLPNECRLAKACYRFVIPILAKHFLRFLR
jgi:hypothetical protein